jgi:hypothetical protein
MSFPRSLRTIVPLALAVALAATLVLTASGSDRTPISLAPSTSLSPPPPPRTGGDLSSYEGLGVWIDIYDSSWSDPVAAVKEMAAHDVRTLYLETSNFDRPVSFVDEAGVTKFVDAAHAFGVRIVAWYLPGFKNVGRDFRRSKAAIAFTTPAGNSFDSFALDIESPTVQDPTARSAALLELSDRIRRYAGADYPLGAIVPSPRGMQKIPTYWPRFPWTGLAPIYDVFMPMTYFTWRVSDEQGAHDYTASNIQLIRTAVGSDQVPIHMIGGIAQDATTAETRGFVDAVRERGLIGASYYTLPGITSGQWTALAKIRPNPVQTPALPTPIGPAPMGDIPGVETTHPNEVVYRTRSRTGTWQLHFDVFDAQRGEISIYVNWHLVGTVAAGTPDHWSNGRSTPVADAVMNDGSANYVAFVATGRADHWGVRNVTLSATG